jgi:hypothetical protein
VTVVIRSIRDPGAEPQYDYLRPGISLDPHLEDALVVRQVQALQALHRASHPERERAAAEALQRMDLFSSYRLLRGLFAELRDLAAMEPYLARVSERHGARADLFAPALRHLARESRIRAMRSEAIHPEHRIFLALLLNVPHRRILYQLIQAEHPGMDPTEQVLRWVRELSAMRSGPGGESVLGVEVDDAALLALRCGLEGLSRDAMLARFSEEFDSAEVAANTEGLVRLSQALRRSPLFGPLLDEAEPPAGAHRG